MTATLLLGTIGSPTPASATISKLCEGYRECREAGMSNGGYAKNSGTMWWRMYTGHNCTNYVAYRLVRSGMPNTRPWEGSGNASNWGVAMSRITDQTPAVGAIAWWRAYAPGAGSSGHVAYVEEVISPTKIVVSQDSWGGDFSWATITASGSGWPTGFIHFNDTPLVSTAPPAIAGTPKVGATLTTDGGAWNPGDPTLAYQWRADGRRIVGATQPTYAVTREDKDRRLSVKVVASKVGYASAKVFSAATAGVLPGQLESTAAPGVTGTPVVDGRLTASPGTWNVPPDAVTYQWAAGGTPVSGATAATFTPAPGHLDRRITVRATAHRDGYDARTVTSTATPPVAPGTLTRTTAASLTGTARPGESLVVDPGAVSPESRVSLQWLRDGAPVPGATTPTYAVTPEDLGARLAARVVNTRSGYTTLTTDSGRTARVKSPTSLTVADRVGRRGTVRLVASVSAPHVAPVAGEVVLRRRGKLLDRVTLVEGRAAFTVTGLRTGTHRFVVKYAPTATTTRSRVAHEVILP